MKLLFYLFCFVFIINAQLSWAKIRIINYRGWDSCCVISNNTISVTIAPKTGARIIRFEKNNVNIIYETSI